MRGLTSQGRKESFDVAAGDPQRKVSMQGCVEGDREAPYHHEEVGHRQVQQDVVQRGPQLLVFDRDVKGEEVDGEGGDDEEEHVSGQEGELPGLSQVVLRIVERAAHHPGLVGHGHIEVMALCSIHGCWSVGVEVCVRLILSP